MRRTDLNTSPCYRIDEDRYVDRRQETQHTQHTQHSTAQRERERETETERERDRERERG